MEAHDKASLALVPEQALYRNSRDIGYGTDSQSN
jgi:hypothetical protein